MIILSCSNISLSFGTVKVLDNISFNIQESDKVGFVGVNGAGKSTLFKIISGIMHADDGDVFVAKDYKIGYLEQYSGLESSNSIWEEVLSVFSHLINMEQRLKQLETKISCEKDDVILSSLMREYSSLSDSFSLNGGYEYNSRVRGVLRGLGFDDERFQNKVETLSGGQKTRLALARLLLEEPDILLLDEPTNHLDILAIEWLEDFLKNYRKLVIIISHDRFFLDIVTNKTMELENCQAKMYNGNYTNFLMLKTQDREIQQKHFEQQQKEITRLEAFIEQQRRWNRERNIVAAESRQKAIDRIQKVEKPQNLPGKIKIKFKSGVISGNDVMFIENLSKEYSGRTIFKNISFKLRKDEKVFLLGPNGCGKSTMLKILCGKIPQTSGSFEYGHNVSVGYFDQEMDTLNDSNTILDEILNCNDRLTLTEIRNALGSFLFTGDDVFKSISVLSGGEKSRVSLLKLMLSAHNLLVLDEPTNHLDINSREALEQALTRFEGTLLIVSHDRYFINKLASRVLELNGSTLLDCAGDYSFFNEYKSRLKKLNQMNSADEDIITLSKQEYTSNKEEKAKQRRIEKQIGNTEMEISDIELRLVKITEEMHNEDTVSDHLKLNELLEEQTILNNRLDFLYELWADLTSGIEPIQ